MVFAKRGSSLRLLVGVAVLACGCATNFEPTQMSRLEASNRLVLGLESNSSENTWSRAVVEDLRTARDATLANHPGPFNPNDPDFIEQLDDSFNGAMVLSDYVRDDSGYRASLRFFANGLEDAHYGISFSESESKLKDLWPGFVVSWRDSSFVVISSEDTRFPVGTVLTSCDGKTATSLLRDEVMIFRGNWQVHGQRYREAAYVFLDDRNPFRAAPQQCMTAAGGNEKLDWRELSDPTAWHSDRVAGTLGTYVAPNFEEYEPRRFWFSLSNFYPKPGEETEEVERAFTEAARRLDDLRDAELLVLDLRHNRGGNSIYADRAASLLWGDDYFNFLRRNPEISATFRVSEHNRDHVATFPKLARDAGADDVTMDYIKRLVAQMNAAFENGENTTTLRVHTDIPEITAGTAENPIKTPVAVFFGATCGSACLDAIDKFSVFPNVTH